VRSRFRLRNDGARFDVHPDLVNDHRILISWERTGA
jgi:hypothetical protein